MRNVEFSHTDLTDLTDFYSFGFFTERQNEYPRCLKQEYLCKSVRSVGALHGLNRILEECDDFNLFGAIVEKIKK
ncbi:hypothetical protein DW079_13205 [Segatella copri]|uniref:Uncharacterized protein n=1 Tax=Segatella copri TaxID=165179 RepID=A0A3R6FV92_9BACT|nr:hypothetical protein DW079_13205 [Segatella copri]